MARVYDGETVLRNMMFDIDRMIKEKNDPADILLVLRRKTNFLGKERKNYNIRWW